MTDVTAGATGGAPGGDNRPMFGLAQHFLKDLSFERPDNQPPQGQEPQFNRQMEMGFRRRSQEVWECSLRMNLRLGPEEAPLFLIEQEYTGLFVARNLSDDQLQMLLSVEAPRQLFPYAALVIAAITRDGGFPPMHLPPVDFQQVYQQRLAEAQKAPTGSA